MPRARRFRAAPQRGRLHRYQGHLSRNDLEPVSLLAAAQEIRRGGNGKSGTPVMPAQQWQTRALGYYHMMGECWNPAQFIATAMSKMRFYPARLDDDGQPEEITAAEEPELVAAVQILQAVASDWGRLLWLTGEGRLCQWREKDDQPDDPVRWGFFSAIEIKILDQNREIERKAYGQGSGTMYRNITDDPGGEEPQPGEMRTWRFWRPDPENSMLADSPIRAILDLYEQLWWLTMSERADLQNRIADNGFMLIPKEIDWKPPAGKDAETTGEDTEDGTLIEYIGEIMLTPLQDPGDASASVPGVIEGPGDRLEQIRMLHTHEGAQSMVFVSQREESLRDRIAENLPLPKEAVRGMSTANHWTAWKVEDEKWQAAEPWVSGFATDATLVFLLPWLQANGMDETIIVAYDASALVQDPDRGATALKLNAAGLLSGGATLNANGWGDDDAMDGEELAWWRAIQLKDQSIATGEAPTDSSGGADEQPPAEPDAQEAPAGEAAALTQVKRQALAFAAARARATVGAALRGRKRSCPECLEGLEDVPNDSLLGRMSQETLDRLGWNTGKCVETMVATFAAVAAELGYDATPHVSPLAQWFLLTLHAPSEALPDDLTDRIGFRGAVSR